MQECFRCTGSVALVIGLAISSPQHASGGEKLEHDTQETRLDACIKNINLIGASLGHRQRHGTEANPLFDFVVRSHAGDFDVACEQRSGHLMDVSPRIRPGYAGQ